MIHIYHETVHLSHAPIYSILAYQPNKKLAGAYRLLYRTFEPTYKCI